jgi:hypothetical protein
MQLHTRAADVTFWHKSNPFWSLAKTLLIPASWGGLLWLFSSSFDYTEVKTLIGGYLVTIVFEGIDIRRHVRNLYR